MLPSSKVARTLQKNTEFSSALANVQASIATHQLFLCAVLRNRLSSEATSGQGAPSLTDFLDALETSAVDNFDLVVRQHAFANATLRRVAMDKGGVRDASIVEQAVKQPIQPGRLFNSQFEHFAKRMADSLDERKKLSAAWKIGPSQKAPSRSSSDRHQPYRRPVLQQRPPQQRPQQKQGFRRSRGQKAAAAASAPPPTPRV